MNEPNQAGSPLLEAREISRMSNTQLTLLGDALRYSRSSLLELREAYWENYNESLSIGLLLTPPMNLEVVRLCEAALHDLAHTHPDTACLI